MLIALINQGSLYECITIIESNYEKKKNKIKVFIKNITNENEIFNFSRWRKFLITVFFFEGAGKKKTYQVLSLDPVGYAGVHRTFTTAVWLPAQPSEPRSGLVKLSHSTGNSWRSDSSLTLTSEPRIFRWSSLTVSPIDLDYM